MVTTSDQFLRLRARYADIFLHEPRWQNLPDQDLPNFRARSEHEITLLTQLLSESEDTDQSTFYQSSLNVFNRRRRAIDSEMQRRTNWRVSREDEILGDDLQLEALQAVRESFNALRRRQGLETPEEEPEDEQFLELNEFLEGHNTRRFEEQFNADSEYLDGRTRRFEERMHQVQQQIHERAPWLLESPAPLPLLVPTNRMDAAENVPSLEPELHHNSRYESPPPPYSAIAEPRPNSNLELEHPPPPLPPHEPPPVIASPIRPIPPLSPPSIPPSSRPPSRPIPAIPAIPSVPSVPSVTLPISLERLSLPSIPATPNSPVGYAISLANDPPAAISSGSNPQPSSHVETVVAPEEGRGPSFVPWLLGGVVLGVSGLGLATWLWKKFRRRKGETSGPKSGDVRILGIGIWRSYLISNWDEIFKKR